jgi:sRNA-binding protein
MILLHFTQLTAGSVCTGSRNGGSSGRNLVTFLERKTGIDIDGDGDAGVTSEQKHMHEEAKHARLAAEQAEKERIAAEQAERELTAAEEAEQERIAAQQAEQESIAAERTEQTSSVLEQNGEFVKQVKQVVSRIFEQSISATKFPMIKGSKSWGTYELTSLQVDRIGIGSGNLSISISDTVDVTITGASAHID